MKFGPMLGEHFHRVVRANSILSKKYIYFYENDPRDQKIYLKIFSWLSSYKSHKCKNSW